MYLPCILLKYLLLSHATLLTKDGTKASRKELVRFVCSKFTNWRTLFDDAYPKLATIDSFLSRTAGVDFARGTVAEMDDNDNDTNLVILTQAVQGKWIRSRNINFCFVITF